MILFPLQPEQLHHAGLERWVRADQLEPDPKLWVPTGQNLTMGSGAQVSPILVCLKKGVLYTLYP